MNEVYRREFLEAAQALCVAQNNFERLGMSPKIDSTGDIEKQALQTIEYDIAKMKYEMAYKIYRQWLTKFIDNV
jgi:hypothetical protein